MTRNAVFVLENFQMKKITIASSAIMAVVANIAFAFVMVVFPTFYVCVHAFLF